MFFSYLKVISFHIPFFYFKTFVLVKPPFPFIAPPSLYPHAWANLETMCTKKTLIMYQTTTTTTTMLKDTHSFVSTRSSVTLLPK